MKNLKAVIAAVVLLGFLGSGAIAFLSLQDGDLVWGLPAVLFVIAVLVSGFGLWRQRAWALKLSWVLAVSAFGFGCYIAHFRWTFWLFQQPTLKDKILAVLDPRASLYIVVPALWLLYSTRAQVRNSFK